ncbi:MULTISPECIES: RNA polymerase sigma factor [Paenibacillus]|uniref:RNA polymerase sigma factor n=1 Tax=Paenibacillus TaxID=44249 RepID=UPI002040177A|nr:RNA polymerase sigma factor [Paenibacillus camelliae]MCM3634178.1 RNA polymerase sigma factor [Paenibacillus camelliae]
MNDNELMTAIKQGDQSAFRALYDRYYDYAVRVATIVLRNQSSLALDAVQEAFIRIYRSADSFRVEQSFKPWFYTVLLNECKRIATKHGKLIAIGDEALQAFERGSYDQHQFEEYAELYDELQRLEEHNRVPIILKYIHDLKDQEIADTLGENLNTIKSRIFKAKQRLRQRLQTTLGGGEG